MSAKVLHERKEESVGPSFEQDWLAACGPDDFIDSPESFNLVPADNLDYLDQNRLPPIFSEENLGSSTYGRNEDIPETKLNPEASDYRIWELVAPTSPTGVFYANVPAEADYVNSSSVFTENLHDEALTTYPDDFLSVETENDPIRSGLADHDYACSPTGPQREPLIEANENRKGAHYQIFRDAVTVMNFDPASKKRAGTRIPFRTLSKVQVTDEIYIFAQYRSDKLSSLSPYEREDTLPPMLPSVVIDDMLQRTLEARGEVCKCKCFRSHPTAAFCVTSEKAEVTWGVVSGIPVARLKVKEESPIVDLSIGFWSTKILNEHILPGKKVFTQIVFHVLDRSSIRKEQIFFYKTCASVTRDIRGFYKEVDKAFPLRPRRDLIPDTSLIDFSSEAQPNRRCGGRKKKLKTAEQMSCLKITINQDFVQEFLDLLKATESGYLEIC